MHPERVFGFSKLSREIRHTGIQGLRRDDFERRSVILRLKQVTWVPSGPSMIMNISEEECPNCYPFRSESNQPAFHDILRSETMNYSCCQEDLLILTGSIWRGNHILTIPDHVRDGISVDRIHRWCISVYLYPRAKMDILMGWKVISS